MKPVRHASAEPQQFGLVTLFVLVAIAGAASAACAGAFGGWIQLAFPAAVVATVLLGLFFFGLMCCIVPFSVALRSAAACYRTIKAVVLLRPRDGHSR